MIDASISAANNSGDTFTWQGKYGKGAMAAHRAQKRAEAETRNARERVHFSECGHRHGLGSRCSYVKPVAA